MATYVTPLWETFATQQTSTECEEGGGHSSCQRVKPFDRLRLHAMYC